MTNIKSKFIILKASALYIGQNESVAFIMYMINPIPPDLLNPTLPNTLMAKYKQELSIFGGMQIETDYEIGIAYLNRTQNNDQLQLVSRMEQLYSENLSFVVSFGFSCGIYAGFTLQSDIQTSFDLLIEKHLLTEPNIPYLPQYYKTACEIVDICNTLEYQLDNIAHKHFLSVHCAWNDRLYGILRQAFLLGHQYALSLQTETTFP